MCKKLLFLTSFIVLLALVGNAAAQLDPAAVNTGHVYLLEDISGGQVSDDSANSLAGTIVGDPQIVTGIRGNALQFDGVDDGVDIPDSGNINVNNGPWPNRTVAAIFKCDDVDKPGKQTVFEEGGTTRGITIYVSEGLVYGAAWNKAEYNWDGAWLSAPVESGNWYGVAVVIRDGTEAVEDDKFEMWVNGQLVAKAPGGQIHNHGNDNAIGYTNQNNVFHDGNASPADGHYFEGAIDEVWILNTALNQAELSEFAGKVWPFAFGPEPADGALVEATWANLAWSPGGYAVSHDVYFGTSFDDVNNGVEGTFVGNTASDFQIVGFPGFPIPEGLSPGTTYYWRVDEVNDADPNSPWKGEVWSFSIPPRTAYSPFPGNGARFVEAEPTLSWTAGFEAKLHNIVFGDNFDDVNSAPAGLPVTDTSFTPGTLELGKTYYWRVDEFDPPTTYKGEVWSFTTLPDIPITDPNLVGWWKFEAGAGTMVVDFSGHGNHGTISGAARLKWVEGLFNLALEFPGDNQGYVELPPGIVTTAKGSILMWINTTQGNPANNDEGMLWYGTEGGGDGYGGQNEIHINIDDPGDGQLDFFIEGATDLTLSYDNIGGTGWRHVAATWDTTQGCTLYVDGQPVDSGAHNNTVVDLATVRLGRPVGTGNGNRFYQGLMDDVRLFDHAIDALDVAEIMAKGEDPLRAGSPTPANGALASVNVAATLTWSAGEGASEHDVYFGTDEAAVANADASDTTGIYKGRQGGTSYKPDGITMDSGPFYWRIDEVAADGTILTGYVWSFSVTNYALVDDFESYNDIPAGEAGSNLVYVTWADGFDNPAVNGSTMGYVTGNSMETDTVHSGSKSVAFQYNNTTAGVSEVVRNFTPAQDWTAHGVITLTLWFAGSGTNVPGQLYVKVNGVQVNYDGDASNLALAGWQSWNIDLTSIGTNLSAVRSLAIGIQGPGATGTLLLDDIRLYALARELITPVQPDPAGLVLHYAFEGNTNDSAGANQGTPFGSPTYVLGKVGQAIMLDGLDDYVAIDNFSYNSDGHKAITVCAWIRTGLEDNQIIISFDRNEYWRLEINGDGAGPGEVAWDVMTDTGQVDYESSGGNTARVDDDQWHHVAGVFDNGTVTLYIDGNPQRPAFGGATFGTGTPRFGYVGLGSESTEFNLDPRTPASYFTGSVDDVRIYERALTDGEVAGLAGRVNPFDKPF